MKIINKGYRSSVEAEADPSSLMIDYNALEFLNQHIGNDNLNLQLTDGTDTLDYLRKTLAHLKLYDDEYKETVGIILSMVSLLDKDDKRKTFVDKLRTFGIGGGTNMLGTFLEFGYTVFEEFHKLSQDDTKQVASDSNNLSWRQETCHVTQEFLTRWITAEQNFKCLSCLTSTQHSVLFNLNVYNEQEYSAADIQHLQGGRYSPFQGPTCTRILKYLLEDSTRLGNTMWQALNAFVLKLIEGRQT